MKHLKGNLILLLTAFIWGTTFVAQSEGMNFVEPFTFNGIRSVIGSIVLLPVVFIMAKKSGLGDKKDLIKGGILCGVLLGVASSLQQIGLIDTTAGKGGFITALYIVIVPLIQIFLGKKLGVKTGIAIVVSIVGMYLLCLSGGVGAFVKGDLYVMACAVVFSFHILAIDKYSPHVNGVALSCIQFFVAGVLNIIAMLIFESPHLPSIVSAGIPILYAGVLSCGVAYTLQIIGQKYTTPVLATIIMSLESVFAALGGWVVLKERMSLSEIIGALLMFAAILTAQMPDGLLAKLFGKRRVDIGTDENNE